MLAIFCETFDSYQLNCIVEAHIGESHLGHLSSEQRQLVLRKCTKKATLASACASATTSETKSEDGGVGWVLRGRVVQASGGLCDLFGQATDGSHTAYLLRPVTETGERIDCTLFVEKQRVRVVEWNSKQRALFWRINETELQVGDECTIHDFSEKPKLNGSVARVCGDLVPDFNWYPVKVLSTGRTHLVERCNLWRHEPQPSAATMKAISSGKDKRIWCVCDLCDSRTANLSRLSQLALKMDLGSRRVRAATHKRMIEIEARDEVLIDFLTDCGWNARDNAFYSAVYRKRPLRTKNWYSSANLRTLRKLLPKRAVRFDGSGMDVSSERLEAVSKALKQQQTDETIIPTDGEFHPDFHGSVDEFEDSESSFEDSEDEELIGALDAMLGMTFFYDDEKAEHLADFELGMGVRAFPEASGREVDELEELREMYKLMSKKWMGGGGIVAEIYKVQRQRVTGDASYDHLDCEQQIDDESLCLDLACVPLPEEFYHILLNERGITTLDHPTKILNAIAEMFPADIVLKGDDALYCEVQKRYKPAKH